MGYFDDPSSAMLNEKKVELRARIFLRLYSSKKNHCPLFLFFNYGHLLMHPSKIVYSIGKKFQVLYFVTPV